MGGGPVRPGNGTVYPGSHPLTKCGWSGQGLRSALRERRLRGRDRRGRQRLNLVRRRTGFERVLNRIGGPGGPAMTFAVAALVSYGMIEWFARPTEAAPAPAAFEAVHLGPALPEDARLLLAVVDPEPAGPELEVPGNDDSIQVLTGHIPSGSTLSASLEAQGIASVTVDAIVDSLRPLFDFRRAHPGDLYTLVRDQEGNLLSFEYHRGRSDVYRLRTGDDGTLSPGHEEVPLERRVVRLSGVVESSLFDTMVALGEDGELVNSVADVFAWDIDFSKETQPGDDFRIVFEKYFDRTGFVRYGMILAAQYRSRGQKYLAVYFEEEDGYGDYFRPDGTSVRRSFLRAPLRYRRISSRYTKSRLHPILKVRRPHEGVDYAAPVGTPVWSVADGKVIFKGWSGGFGRLVKVRHNNGYVSYYGHLSAYADGLRVGERVRQKEVVGFVGATGLATGPHLDYRLKVKGRFVDPLRIQLPDGEPISVRDWGRFVSVRDRRVAELSFASSALPLSASR